MLGEHLEIKNSCDLEEASKLDPENQSIRNDIEKLKKVTWYYLYIYLNEKISLRYTQSNQQFILGATDLLRVGQVEEASKIEHFGRST